MASARGGGSKEKEMVEAVRRRAQEIYEAGDKQPGHEVEDWLRAEAEVMREASAALRHRTAHIVIKVHGVTYTGEYDPESCGGYQPGELRAGQPLQVRFEEDRMYIMRPNGRELEARVVKKV